MNRSFTAQPETPALKVRRLRPPEINGAQTRNFKTDASRYDVFWLFVTV